MAKIGAKFFAFVSSLLFSNFGLVRKIAGTLLTAELALEHGIACNTAGGKDCLTLAFSS